MDATATIIFRSGKMGRLFEGGYCSSAATIQGCACACYLQYNIGIV